MNPDYPSYVLVFSSGAVPVMAAFLILYGICTNKNMGKISILPKCAGSFVSLFASAVFCYISGVSPFASLIFWGLLLCVAADALLDIHFISGMAAFGLAHILFIIRFSAGFSWYTPIIFAVLYALAIAAFRKDFKTVKKCKWMFYLYPMVLAAMAALAVSLPFKLGFRFWPAALGGLLFAFSDSLVGKSFFGKKFKNIGAIIMSTYYAALYLISINSCVY